MSIRLTAAEKEAQLNRERNSKKWKNETIIIPTLDESRITSTSYPYIFALLKAAPKDAHAFMLTSDFQELNSLEYKGGGSASITGAKIEGMVPYDRKGSISLIDPTGQWAHNLVIVGSESNDYHGGSGSNIHISFGWKGLKPLGGSTEFIREIDGFIFNVEQDMTPEGIFTATINFIDYSTAATLDIKFMHKKDMQWGIPGRLFNLDHDSGSSASSSGADISYWTGSRHVVSNGARSTSIRQYNAASRRSSGSTTELNEISKSDRKTTRKPQELLEKICNGKNGDGNNDFYFSVGKSLNNKNVLFVFSGAEKTKEIKQDMFPKIRFGDNLDDYIDDVIALMEPTDDFLEETTKKNYLLTYEKVGPTTYAKDSAFITINGNTREIPGKENGILIAYYWKITPDESKDMSTNDWSEMFPPEEGPTLKLGPRLVYKYNGDIDKNSKLIIDWSSDLSSHTYLIHLFQDELTKKFSSFTDSDWTNLEEIFAEEGMDDVAGTIESKFNKVDKSVLSGKDMSDHKNFKYYRAQGLMEAMTEVESALDNQKSQNRAASLRSVIMDNAFKANAVIMGDPSFGTDLKGAESEMTSDFREVGELGDMVFSRRWLLLKTVHTFEEGKYTTNAELLGYPDTIDSLWKQRESIIAYNKSKLANDAIGLTDIYISAQGR